MQGQLHYRMNFPNGVIGQPLTSIGLVFRSLADVPKCFTDHCDNWPLRVSFLSNECAKGNESGSNRKQLCEPHTIAALLVLHRQQFPACRPSHLRAQREGRPRHCGLFVSLCHCPVESKGRRIPHMKPNTFSLVLFALLTDFAPTLGVEAVLPPPDGDYPGGNTAEGKEAL